MAFSNKNDDSAMSEINVTPLVDVMLVLLIIFIITAPLMTQSITVHLPETVKDSKPADDPEDHIVTIELSPEGKLTMTKKGQTLWSFQSNEKAKIEGAFKELLIQDKEPILAFSADKNSLHGDVMKIMQLAENAGITRISFLTTEEHL